MTSDANRGTVPEDPHKNWPARPFPPDLGWSDGERSGSLTTVRDHLQTEAHEAITWYVRNKKWKKRLARWLRLAAILLVSAAALVPILAQAGDAGALWNVQPILATILLAVAGALIALDRFFGYSTGWIRFIETELAIREALRSFDLAWERRRVALAGREPTVEEADGFLEEAAAFAGSLHGLVRAETEEWIQEFRRSLRDIDQQAAAREAASRPGSLEVTVVNGDETDVPWELVLDHRPPHVHTGRSAAVTSVNPGHHKVKVRGRMHDRAVSAEAIAIVRPGETSTVELTLS